MTSGRGSSTASDAGRSPALGLGLRAESWVEGCRARFAGLAEGATAPLMPAEFGGFFAVIEGDGEDVDDAVTPFVWIPGGGARFILDARVGITGGGIAVTTGAISPRASHRGLQPSSALRQETSARRCRPVPSM